MESSEQNWRDLGIMHNDNSIEDIIIDIKSMPSKKPKIELQTIIKEESVWERLAQSWVAWFGSKSVKVWCKSWGYVRFSLIDNVYRLDTKAVKHKDKLERIQKRRKEQKLTFEDKVFLYSTLKQTKLTLIKWCKTIDLVEVLCWIYAES